MRAARIVLGIVLGLLARIWGHTLRRTLTFDPQLDAQADRPWVYCFFHGTQFPLVVTPRRRPTVAMVSLSRDGWMQSALLRMNGIEVVRGSTSKRAVGGLRATMRHLGSGRFDAAFAVDGPRGPYGSVQPGAARAALSTGGVIVPVGSYAPRGWTLRRAWDKLRIPWPFSRVVVRLGAPVDVAHADDPAGTLARAIEDANREARACATSS